MSGSLFIIQGLLQFFIGLGAVICGILFMLAPDGHYIGAPLALLRQTPFTDFFIPGLILFCINGLGQIFAGLLSFRRHTDAGLFGGILGLGLIIWIFVQVNMIGGRDALQYAYFTLGLIETTLAFFIDRRVRKSG